MGGDVNYPARYCLGALIGFDTRVMLFANTGAGKTMFAMALSVAAYLGRSFLGWEATGERMRVLFIDGEMPRTLMQDRIKAAFAWFGENLADHRDGIFFLSREDFPGMPPLDTAEGQQWFGDVITQLTPDLGDLRQPDGADLPVAEGRRSPHFSREVAASGLGTGKSRFATTASAS